MLGWSLNLEKEKIFYEPCPSYYMIGSILYLICTEHLLALHGAQAIIVFSHYYSLSTLLLLLYFPNILLKPLKSKQ